MFTHQQVEAWDPLGSALIRAGFRMDASWPVQTESDASTHQAKENAAANTILLVCRKREKASTEVWWDDLKGQVWATARQKTEEFEQQGIKGVDLDISTFGRSVMNWTSSSMEYWKPMRSPSPRSAGRVGNGRSRNRTSALSPSSPVRSAASLPVCPIRRPG